MELARSLLGLAEIAQTLPELGLFLYSNVFTLYKFYILPNVLGEDQLLAFFGVKEDVEDFFRRQVF